MPVKQFKLPDLGEGLTEGDILKWTVAVGDTVDVNDTIAEVETVKAAVELPSPFAGVVTALHAEEGETVPVGTPIISIEVAADVPSNAAAGEDLVPGLPGEGAVPTEEKQLTLVGYGPRDEAGGRRRRRRPEATAAGTQTAFNTPPASAPHPVPEPAAVEPAPEPGPAPRHLTATARPHRVLAKPPVRKLAKTLGVDLAGIEPTGPNGTVSRDDVQAAANGAGADQWLDSASGGQVSPATGAPDQPRSARRGCRSRASASTRPRRWCTAPSPRRTSPSSSPATSRR